MEQWCKENIGQGSWGGQYAGDTWSIASVFGNTTFKFINEEDYNRFKLTWTKHNETF